MKKGRHKLAIASGGCSHFADVSVTIRESSDENRILDQSGAPQEFVDGAVYGIEQELKKTEEKKEVTIERIEFTLADSTPQTVAFSACLAVRKALDLVNYEYPKFEGREIVFK